jgi:hypothetical protein
MEIVAVVRDLVIIIVGLIWMAAGVLVAVAAWASWKLVKSAPRRAEAVTIPAQELLGQARETLGAANDTARTAKGAVTFIAEKAVIPTIAAASTVAGVRRFVEILISGPGREGRASER